MSLFSNWAEDIASMQERDSNYLKWLSEDLDRLASLKRLIDSNPKELEGFNNYGKIVEGISLLMVSDRAANYESSVVDQATD